jgi:hypothetical protein
MCLLCLFCGSTAKPMLLRVKRDLKTNRSTGSSCWSSTRPRKPSAMPLRLRRRSQILPELATDYLLSLPERRLWFMQFSELIFRYWPVRTVARQSRRECVLSFPDARSRVWVALRDVIRPRGKDRTTPPRAYPSQAPPAIAGR